jgi:hypothetical protein
MAAIMAADVEVMGLQERVAFYPSKVRAIEVK